MRRVKKVVITLLLAVLGWFATCTLAVWLLTHRLGSPVPETPPPGYANLRLQTKDGVDLGAWYGEASGETAVILLHGDENSRSAMPFQAIPFRKMGASVLLVSLRAHGDSSGRFNDFGLSAAPDVLAAVDYLEQKGHKRIFIDGVSLGAATSIFAAGELGERVDGYILECLFLDLDTALDHRTHMFLPPGVAGLASWTLKLVSPVSIKDYKAISPLVRISDIPESVPVLLLGGAADPYVPSQEMRLLAQRVDSHSQLILFPKAGHNDLRKKYEFDYDRIVTSFCKAPSGDHPKPSIPELE